LHPSDEFSRTKRFGHVVVGSGKEPIDTIALTDASGEHNDRCRAHGANLTTDFETVGSWKHDIENDEGRRALANDRDRGGSIACNRRFVTGALQITADNGRGFGLVLDDENVQARIAYLVARASRAYRELLAAASQLLDNSIAH
jgi:hypothetical protein